MSVVLGKSKLYWVWSCVTCGATGAALSEAAAYREQAYHDRYAQHGAP